MRAYLYRSQDGGLFLSLSKPKYTSAGWMYSNSFLKLSPGAAPAGFSVGDALQRDDGDPLEIELGAKVKERDLQEFIAKANAYRERNKERLEQIKAEEEYRQWDRLRRERREARIKYAQEREQRRAEWQQEMEQNNGL